MDAVLALEPDGPVVRLSDALDDPVSLVRIVERALEVPSQRLVLDLRQVRYIDEHGVSGIIAAHKLCEAADVELRLAQSDAVHARLQLYGLGSAFSVTHE